MVYFMDTRHESGMIWGYPLRYDGEKRNLIGIPPFFVLTLMVTWLEKILRVASSSGLEYRENVTPLRNESRAGRDRRPVWFSSSGYFGGRGRNPG